jgi:hypothetical protein
MNDACYCDDGEYPSVYEERDVKAAREAHKCSECARAILPGESYKHIWGVWPGIDGAATWRICARCMALKDFVEAHIPCACLLLGNLLDSASDEIENCDEPDVLRPEYAELMADIRAHPIVNAPPVRLATRRAK